MSKTKLLTLAVGVFMAASVSAQSLAEQADAVRTKEAKEQQERAAKDAPPKVEPAKPAAKPVIVRTLSFQVHGVFNREGTWFAEIARANLLSLATVGVQIEQGKVVGINSQGVALTYPPDAKCLKKKAKLKGKKAETLVCGPVTNLVPVGGYF